MEQNANWDEVEEALELMRDGDDEAAEKHLRAITHGSPSNEYAHYFLGNLFFEKGSFGEALNCYVRALEIHPKYAGALLGSGHALRLMGKLDSAVRVGKQLLLQRPNDADALFLLGLSYFAQGENEPARGYLLRFLDAKPELEPATEARGILEVIEGKMKTLETL